MAGTTVVVGGRVADNVQTDMPGGVIRGFDVITGQMRWAFDPGNPDKTPRDGSTYVRSTPNSWAPMSYDPAMNTVFLPMGSSSTDIYGVERTRSTTPTAPRAGAGRHHRREKWVFQTVHNDLWDFDLPMQPSLIDFTKDGGKTVPALVIGTKAGQIYVLDRATGKPLTDVKKSRSSRQHPQRALLANPAEIGGHAADRRADPDRIGHVGRHPVRPVAVPHRLQEHALRRPVHRAGHRQIAELSRLAGRHELGQPVH
jgi:glucose dehydrogenase